MGFPPSRADQDLWLKKLGQHKGYDCIATHVDDLIIMVKEPQKYMNHIEQHVQVRDVTDSPKSHLGNDVILNGKKIYISTKTYVKEDLQKYQENLGVILKENLPIKPTERPELDEIPLLGVEQHK
eukprot:8370211-Ditylum_brightwellii.AAC.1